MGFTGKIMQVNCLPPVLIITYVSYTVAYALDNQQQH